MTYGFAVLLCRVLRGSEIVSAVLDSTSAVSSFGHQLVMPSTCIELAAVRECY